MSVRIHAQIIDQLARIPALSVISRTAVLAYGNSDIPPAQIAEELQVRTILEAHVLYVNGRVRVTAQLIDVEQSLRLWSQTYDRTVGDIADIRAEIAAAIADEVGAVLLSD